MDNPSRVSPVASVAAITADVLLIHGKDDIVVPMEQSERMVKAMKKIGKPIELIVLEGEGHQISQPKTRIELLTAVERVLDRHLGPAPVNCGTSLTPRLAYDSMNQGRGREGCCCGAGTRP